MGYSEIQKFYIFNFSILAKFIAEIENINLFFEIILFYGPKSGSKFSRAILESRFLIQESTYAILTRILNL